MIVLQTRLRAFAMSVGPVIVTGIYLGMLSRPEQDAVIAHEAGHIVHMHALRRVWWALSGQWSGIRERCRQQEFEADRFAMMRGHSGALVRFLRRVRAPASQFHPSSDDRIAAIRSCHVL